MSLKMSKKEKNLFDRVAKEKRQLSKNKRKVTQIMLHKLAQIGVKTPDDLANIDKKLQQKAYQNGVIKEKKVSQKRVTKIAHNASKKAKHTFNQWLIESDMHTIMTQRRELQQQNQPQIKSVSSSSDNNDR